MRQHGIEQLGGKMWALKVKSGRPRESRENLLSVAKYWTGIIMTQASQHRGVSMGIGGKS